MRTRSSGRTNFVALFRGNVLGIEISQWLHQDCGTFYLSVSRMPLVNSHSNQCLRTIFFLDFFFLLFFCISFLL